MNIDRDRLVLRPRLFQRKARPVGLSPGTVAYVGEKRAEPVRLKLIAYDDSTFEERDVSKVDEAFPYRDRAPVSWIDVTGVHDAELLQQLGDHYRLHPLVLEDVVNTHQRPKIEDYGDYLYIVIRMLLEDERHDHIVAEQISIIFGKNFVISVQEDARDVFDPVRDRLRQYKGRIRKMGTDYLVYALLDSVIDHYFVILERYGEEIEDLEDQLLIDPTPQTVQKVHHLKREMITLRKSVWPLREVVSALERGESSLVKKGTTLFLRDLYDHSVQAMEAVEIFRDMIAGMQDLYLSSISNRMNEVMKVLTIIATIFVPLTFFAGVYGMNFEHMPELKWKWGYLLFWIVAAAIAGWMVGVFRKRRWL